MCNRELMIGGIDRYDAALQCITLSGGWMGAAGQKQQREGDEGLEAASPEPTPFGNMHNELL
ncbi:MAG: hypothetical protein WAL85_14970 [Candidatus Korobacteraceae bacterium]